MRIVNHKKEINMVRFEDISVKEVFLLQGYVWQKISDSPYASINVFNQESGATNFFNPGLRVSSYPNAEIHLNEEE